MTLFLVSVPYNLNQTADWEGTSLWIAAKPLEPTLIPASCTFKALDCLLSCFLRLRLAIGICSKCKWMLLRLSVLANLPVQVTSKILPLRQTPFERNSLGIDLALVNLENWKELFLKWIMNCVRNLPCRRSWQSIQVQWFRQRRLGTENLDRNSSSIHKNKF